MKKILLVMRQELITTLLRPSYIIIAFVIPVLAVVILAGVKYFQNRDTSATSSTAGPSDAVLTEAEGFIDPGGLIQVLPPNIASDRLIRFEDEILAKEALKSGKISAYYIIPDNYIEQGKFFYVYPEDKPLISDGQDWVMRWTLVLNLMGGDVEAADLAWNPIWRLEETSIAPPSQQAASGEDCSRPNSNCQSNELVRLIPSIVVILFYISFLSSSNMLFTSIGTEKENRTLEVLLQSLNPRQLLGGKILALGIAGLLQTAVWLGATYVLFTSGGQTISLPEGFTFPVYIVVWGVVFFVGGYFEYASLMAGTGAMVPKLKEAGAANMITMLPILVGYIIGLIAPLAEKADAILPVVLSIFPLTAPVVMVMRLTNGTVPLWQVIISAALTYVTAYFILRAAASMFQAQTLLSGQPFSAKRYFRALFGMG
jgi:ABC-2 type transport system permease protein